MVIKHWWNRSRCPGIVRSWVKIVAVVALWCLAGDARAQPIFVTYTWNNPAGGSYHTAGNWTPSSGFGGIPDSDSEGALFSLDAEYTVNITSQVETNSAAVGEGDVTWGVASPTGLPRTYALNTLIVGPTASGGDPVLSVEGGTVVAEMIQVSGGGTLVQRSDGAINFEDGSATVTGEGSTWVSEGSLLVGDPDNSQIGNRTFLTIEDGGSVSSNNATVGFSIFSTSTVTVTGAGSNWNEHGVLRVGEIGRGILTIEGGGVVSGADASVGFGNGSIGTATVTGEGSTWTNSSALRVGDNRGSGTLTIEAGGRVESAGGTINFNSISDSTVTVDGAGSAWNNSAELVVGSGDGGAGILEISGGGSVQNSEGFVGSFSDAVGMVTVSGAGSNWTNNGALQVGGTGEGTLIVEDGGTVTNTQGEIDKNSFTPSTATITGPGSTWTNDGALIVGDRVRGTLSVVDGGTVTVAADSRIGRIGDAPNAIGEVTVSHAGSSWTTSGTLFVGDQGKGTVTIASGGSVSDTHAIIAAEPESLGMVTVSGADAMWTTNGRLSIGGNAIDEVNGGEGTLRIEEGGMVSVAEDIVLFSDGLLELTGGELATNEFTFQGGQFDWNGGALHVDLFDGDLLNQGGTLAPGTSTGNSLILGDYMQQQTGTLEIELGGTGMGTTFDFVNVAGNAIVDGELALTLVDEFVPPTDATFLVFNANTLLGIFDNVANGERLVTTDGRGSFVVHYGVGSEPEFDSTQITLTDFQLTPGLPGDFNDDGVVNAADYVVWRNYEGMTIALPNDPTGGEVGQAQYDMWVDNFSSALGGGFSIPHSAIRTSHSIPIPEPSGIVSLVTAMVLLLGVRHSNSSRW